MILVILGIAAVIVASVLAYRTANDYDRNGIVWAILVLVVGFGIQIILPVCIVIIYAIYTVASGGEGAGIGAIGVGSSLILSVGCLILSVVAIMLILRHLSKVPEDKPFTAPPLPPDTFN